MGNIEVSNNKIDLPKEFDGIQNKEQFIGIFEKVKSWYGGSFSDKEQKIISEVWNKGCNEYKDGLNSTRLAILGNRIDTGIFEYRYPKFVNIDKNIIRKINDANKQRKFRDVALKLIKKYNNLFESDLKIIESGFKEAFSSGKVPVFDVISEKIKKNRGDNNQDNNQENNEGNSDNTPDNNNINPSEGNSNELVGPIYTNIQWPSDAEVQEMLKLKISPFFEEIKKKLFEIKEFNESSNKKYIEGFFNYCADEMSSFKLDLQADKELKDKLLNIFVKHSFLISEGIERSNGKLNKEIKDQIYDMHEEKIEELIDDVNIDDDSVDFKKYELSKKDEKIVDFAFKKFGGKHDKEYITKCLKKLKHYEEELTKRELTKEEQKEYENLKEFFNQTKRLKELEEIKQNEHMGNHEYHVRNIKASIEYATGNIKDIHPIAIVENNKQISKYIYGDKDTQEKLDFNNINLSDKDKIRLFNKLKKQKAGDMAFMKSKDYFDDNLIIKEDLVNLSGVSMENVIERKKEIEKMINDLAVQENLEKQDKERIKEINVRRSCMVCCFRAISKFFDTVNNNGENFANEFKIEDVNENIEFNEETGIITMKGTIGANGNHVKLYYDTKNGTLEFDDFLVYNTEDGSKSYSIGNGNKKRRKIGLTLPKMSEMEKTAKSINSDLIGKLSLNMNQYNRMQGFAMSEAIYLKHFIGLLGVNMESVKGEVQKFNEENILKQDIIKTIYSKFYNVTDINEKLSDCLIIDEGNKPEQFKLIELIYNTIDNYRKEGNTSKLLRLRNCINEFDKILTTNHELVEKDNLLRYLFADNPNIKNDAVDSSKNILENENKDLTICNNNKKIITYQNHNDMIEYQKYENQGNKELNYYIFLNLLAKDEGDKRIINLDWFENVLKIMNSNDGSQISEMNYVSFRENIDNFKNQQDIYSIESAWGNAYEK